MIDQHQVASLQQPCSSLTSSKAWKHLDQIIEVIVEWNHTAGVKDRFAINQSTFKHLGGNYRVAADYVKVNKAEIDEIHRRGCIPEPVPTRFNRGKDFKSLQLLVKQYSRPNCDERHLKRLVSLAIGTH